MLRNTFLAAVGALFIGGCFTGTKYVPEGDKCFGGLRGIHGAVVCEEGLVCTDQALGGICLRPCGAGQACSSDSDGGDSVCCHLRSGVDVCMDPFYCALDTDADAGADTTGGDGP
jgi:hypothetical protein